jgi:serine/threonine protein kinase
MPLASGTRLGPYEIDAPLGAGGMGEVYSARDTRLDRTVAIKVLPSHRSDQPEARERFDREARAIAALNHPNICQIYDGGSQGPIDYLVLEYLQGVSLADRLATGAIPFHQILRFSLEVADALDAAHRRGIIHRDLKPGNIFLTAHGECKVLDFGLAKLVDEDVPEAATATSPVTMAGTAVGTIAYMSPEQAGGETLDERTDIFSFGAVLYEMATGKPAFQGKTSAVIFKAILDETPVALSERNPILPERLQAYALSHDGKTVAFSTRNDSGKTQVWLASVDRRSSPRQLQSSTNEDSLSLLPDGDLLIRSVEGSQNFLYRMRPDGTDRRKITPDPIFDIFSTSPDGRWVIASTKGSDDDHPYATVAYPVNGGDPQRLCNVFCADNWDVSGKYFYMVFDTLQGFNSYMMPVNPARGIPDLPSGGMRGDADLKAALKADKRVVVIPRGIDSAAGPNFYTYTLRNTRQNIYRIPLPD